MEAVVRALQGAWDAGPAPFVAIVDEVQTIGGDAILKKVRLIRKIHFYMRFTTITKNHCLIFAQLLQLAVGAVRDGRWPGRSVTIAALAAPPSAYHHLLKRIGNDSGIVTYIDCWTNPYGWPASPRSEKKQNESRESPSTATAALPLFQPPSSKSLDNLLQRVLAQPKTILFIDSISPLIDTFGLPSVCSLLTKLRNNAVSVVFLLHSDLHSQHEVATLCHGTACLADLVPANERSEHSIQPHGRVVLKFRRKTGAVKTEGLDYRINIDSGVEFLPNVSSSTAASSSVTAPPKTAPAGAAAAAAPPATSTPAAVAAAGSVVNGLGQQLAGGMRLDVSAEEAVARSQVQLPYEHQGQGQLYASGGDFRDYLPEAAGGRRRGTGRLGHILYVRDSDSEDPDSDEDPDDDLDV
jgi:elongator complex protein 5